MLRVFLSAHLLVGWGASGALRAESPSPAYTLGKVREHLQNKDGLPFDVRGRAEQLEQYYGKPNARLLWLEPAKADELIAAIFEVSADGLAGIDGSINRLETRKQALRSSDASFIALVELTFSAHFLMAAESLFLGRTDLYSEGLHKRTLERFIHADRVLELAGSQRIAEVLKGLEPKQPDYQAIRAKLIEYVLLQKKGGWAPLKAGPDRRQGDKGAGVSDLWARLTASGDAKYPENAGIFDANLEKAVRQFQRQHNLPQSGIADRRTVLALNIPIQDRIVQLTANLERWRWFEEFRDEKLVVININANRLELRQEGNKARFFPIKVDTACEQHPAFNSTIDHVDLNPSFTFPRQLSGRYILPVLQRKPAELDPSIVIYAAAPRDGAKTFDWKAYSEENFPFSIGQPPGRSNLLGSFRIPLKDDGEVFIHGGPVLEPKLPIPRKLWPACVSVSGTQENVTELLIALGAKTPMPIDDSMKEEAASNRVELAHPIPVVFLYSTMWLDGAGGLVFGPDPLGLDVALARKLLGNSGS
jgi:L,D-transpeptidase YcbB